MAETAVTMAMRISTIEEWVHACFKDHLGCRFSSLEKSGTPARFIDVGVGDTTVRLIDTNTLPSSHRPSYTALSHCWGEGGVPFRATVANLAALKREIPSASLTPTFRDAIAVTRLLEIWYLWIDALCIVQDDKADWEREAAKMASVFRCAYVTLAAASPMAKGNGLELANIPPSTQFRLRPNRKSGNPESQDLRILLRPPEAAGLARLDLFYDSPMHGRGWIFQEMVLSSRIVYFINGQLFWQCQSVFESEDRTMQVNDRRVEWSLNTSSYPNYLVSRTRSLDGPMANSDAIKRDFIWWTWVLEHSSRKLTNPNDDLPSLAGAVDFYRRLSGDEPVVGLWLKEIAFHLSWQVITTDKVPSREPGQPSWSWTSIPHAHRGHNLGIRHLPLANPPRPWHVVDPSNNGAPDDLVEELGTGMVVM